MASKFSCRIRKPMNIRLALLCLMASFPVATQSQAQTAPVFAIPTQGSSVKFFVSASVPVSGTFNDWNADLACTSSDAANCVLSIQIQAGSVNTGSGLKDRKLKSDDFFAADKYPFFTFRSTKIVQTGPNAFEVDGRFTVRGVTKMEKLTLTVSGAGTGSGNINGTMAFNRKDYGISGSIPLVRIADTVQVTVDLKVLRTSGPPLILRK
jgi:polyisoprenoid-binding protein YceI